jgi:predicted O-methyltransferase YrrM
MDSWISFLFEQPDLRRMGHGQRTEDRNLGLGWLYYAIGRIVRPRRAVVIGSYRGFVPLVIGKALQDNLEPGEVMFVEPSRVDSFWEDPESVRRHFREFGVENVRHFRATTQEFVETEAYRTLGEVGLVFIDGYHSEEQARFDYEAFERLVGPRGFVLFHDSMVVRPDKVYGEAKAYEMRVKYFLDELKKDPGLQVMDWPFGVAGLTLVRKLDPHAPEPRREWIEGRP